MTFDIGSTIRLNGRLVIFLGPMPAWHPQAGVPVTWQAQARRFRRLTDRDTVEYPATCHTCCRSSWWWTADLLPRCRSCDPPPFDWDMALLGAAIAIMVRTVAPDPVLVEAARTVCMEAFERGDFDLLQRVQGLNVLTAACSDHARTQKHGGSS